MSIRETGKKGDCKRTTGRWKDGAKVWPRKELDDKFREAKELRRAAISSFFFFFFFICLSGWRAVTDEFREGKRR